MSDFELFTNREACTIVLYKFIKKGGTRKKQGFDVPKISGYKPADGRLVNLIDKAAKAALSCRLYPF